MRGIHLAASAKLIRASGGIALAISGFGKGVPQAHAILQYNYTDLGTFGGQYSSADGINASGQVVGQADFANGLSHAVLWQNGSMTDLGTLGGTKSAAFGINDSGQIAGEASTNFNAAYHPFIYQNGGMADIYTVDNRGSPNSIAYAINSAGQIVGNYNGGDAFLYQNGNTTDLGALGGSQSYAWAVNASGQIVGYRAASDERAFLYQNSNMGDLGTLLTGNAGDAAAYGINDSGQIVGWSDTPPGTGQLQHAFLYQNGGMADLGTLGGTKSAAKSINNVGQIVGDSYTNANGGDHAFLYQNGKMTDLNSLIPAGSGTLLTYPHAINDSGWIVGVDSILGTVNSHAFLLTPAQTWNVDAAGNWSNAGNWFGGTPLGAGGSAAYGDAITAPRTITVDVPLAIGSISLNNTNRYTIAGNTLTLNGGSGRAKIGVTTGSHTISAPVILNSDLAVTVAMAGSVLTMPGDLTATGRAVSKDGAGSWEVKNLRAGSLSISAGTLRVLSNETATGTSVFGAAPTITGTGKFDINDNAMVINYTGSSPLASIRQYIKTGRGPAGFGNATWNGSGGIMSSKASPAAQGLGGIGNGVDPAIGYGENSAMPIATFTAFNGQTVNSSSILIKYTRGADATLDGKVDNSDVTVVGTEFNNPNSGQWYLGDFDYSGMCDNSDVTALGTLFNPTAPPLSPAQLNAEFGSAFAQAFAAGQASAAVPEPGIVALFGVAPLLLRRRRRGFLSLNA